MDGLPTENETPHTFGVDTFPHTFQVPSIDPQGHEFKFWDTGETETIITVNEGGTYIAYYGMPPLGGFAELIPYIAFAIVVVVIIVGIFYTRKFRK